MIRGDITFEFPDISASISAEHSVSADITREETAHVTAVIDVQNPG